MKFNSHYIWESGSVEKPNPVSVVLQQVKLKHCRCLLACVCDGSKSGDEAMCVSGYFTERLVEWFHRQCIPKLQNLCWNEGVQCLLECELSAIQAELEEYGVRKNAVIKCDISGMIIYEEIFCYFSMGENRGYLFNRRFNKKQCRDLNKCLLRKEKHDQIQLVQGTLQRDVAVLIGNSSFGANILSKEMIEVLFEEKLADKEIKKRLKELWSADIERGQKGYAGAVFFRTE